MDVSIMIENIKFNYRVAAVIKNGEKVLLHKSKMDNFYAFPGGRIKICEDSEAALKREVREEIDTEILIKKYLGTIENFFEYDGKKYHEVLIVYEAAFGENTKLYDEEKIIGIEENGKLEFIWKSLDEIKDLDVRPIFLKEKLLKHEEVGHLINKNENK